MKELAEMLGITTAMVSKLAKRGMPTDSLERAQRWRKRNLQFTRTKGIRVDTVPNGSLAHASRETVPSWPPPPISGFDWTAPDLQIRLAEYLGQLAVHDFLQYGPELKKLLAALPDSDSSRVRLPLEVWDRMMPAGLLEEVCLHDAGGGEDLSDQDLAILGDLAIGRRSFRPA